MFEKQAVLKFFKTTSTGQQDHCVGQNVIVLAKKIKLNHCVKIHRIVGRKETLAFVLLLTY